MTIRDAFLDHQKVVAAATRLLPPMLEEVCQTIEDALARGGKILVAGNGGSAADAQHFATELVCRVRQNRRGLSAIALTTDTSALTAIANDHGFESVFSRQVQALARSNDLVVVISTSGRSPNILEAARVARAMGCAVVGFTGLGGFALAELVDLCVTVPSDDVSRIQEIHGLCLHAVAETIELHLLEEEG